MKCGPAVMFWVPGLPKAKERPRVLKSGLTFTPKETLAWEKRVALFAKAAGVREALRPRKFLVQMLFKLGDPWKPDGDNLEKAVLDGLSGKRAHKKSPALPGVAFRDDKQVWRSHWVKSQAKPGHEGVKVIIQEILDERASSCTVSHYQPR
jgi:Holliday junction resolvase RusA-like endonuclease